MTRGRAIAARPAAPLPDDQILEALTAPVAIPGWAIEGIIAGLALVAIALS